MWVEGGRAAGGGCWGGHLMRVCPGEGSVSQIGKGSHGDRADARLCGEVCERLLVDWIRSVEPQAECGRYEGDREDGDGSDCGATVGSLFEGGHVLAEIDESAEEEEEEPPENGMG
jgi:hypothetical protein